MSSKSKLGIFKAYDVRGKYPTDLNEELAEKIGRAVADYIFLKRKKKNIKILLGGDVRATTAALKKSFIKGLISQGADVWDAGVGTTPYFSFLSHVLKPDCGVVVTASHNPKEYGGFKIRDHKGDTIISGQGLEKIEEAVRKGKFKKVKNIGKIEPAKDYRQEYLQNLSKRASLKRKVRVVIDAGSGSTGLLLPELLELFPSIEYTPLFFEVDGTFSKHAPNPLLPESRIFAEKELKKRGYDFGVVFDGDGDRIQILDEKGGAVKTENFAALLVEKELKEKPGVKLAVPVNSSKGAREFIIEKEGKIIPTKIGYAFIQEAMKKKGADFGVEISGHVYFKNFHCLDSVLLAFLILADLISKSKKPLSELVRGMEERYVSSGELNFHIEEDKKKVLARVKKIYLKKGKLSELDGITFDFPDWWFILRPSNTEPILRLVMEAKTNALLEEKLREVKNLIGVE